MQAHHIDIQLGSSLRNGTAGESDFMAKGAEIAARLKPNRKRLNIMSMLATGWLPWGIEWASDGETPNLPLCDGRYIMCCGHTLDAKEAQEFVSAGLLAAGEPDRFGRPTLVTTQSGKVWLQRHWK